MRRLLVSTVCALALVACGGDSPETTPEPTTTVATVPEDASPDTTGYSDNPCFKFPVEVLKLQNDYRFEVRSVAGADEAKYRARAQALVDEAHSLGCPTPVGLSSFLD